MKKFISYFLCIAILMTSLSVTAKCEENIKLISTSLTGYERDGFKLDQINKFLPNGDLFWSRKFEFAMSSDLIHQTQIKIPGDTGTAKYFNRTKNQWETILLNGIMPPEVIFIDTNKQHMVISPAFSYTPQIYDCLQDNPELLRPIKVNKIDGYFIITMQFVQKKGTEGHIWALQSSEPLIDWNENQESLWKVYVSTVKQRWTYYGFYYSVPVSYEPYSPTMFWRNPSAYLASSLTKIGGSRVADDLSYAFLDTILTFQEPEGYWLSAPKSVTFLWDNYQIDAGFYDTRFNADITSTMFIGYEKTKDERFLSAALRQCDFFIDFAQNNNFNFSDNGREGILVEDYYHPSKLHFRTHSSLNHQLSEILVLYYAWKHTNKAEYFDMAEKMLNGIKLTRDLWLRPDNSLEYAYMPNTTMGFSDYPYLTYNDLFIVQRMREDLGLGRDADLQILMDAKKIHMDANNITEYLQ